jgi:hypothetical protein
MHDIELALFDPYADPRTLSLFDWNGSEFVLGRQKHLPLTNNLIAQLDAEVPHPKGGRTRIVIDHSGHADVEMLNTIVKEWTSEELVKLFAGETTTLSNGGAFFVLDSGDSNALYVIRDNPGQSLQLDLVMAAPTVVGDFILVEGLVFEGSATFERSEMDWHEIDAIVAAGGVHDAIGMVREIFDKKMNPGLPFALISPETDLPIKARAGWIPLLDEVLKDSANNDVFTNHYYTEIETHVGGTSEEFQRLVGAAFAVFANGKEQVSPPGTVVHTIEVRGCISRGNHAAGEYWTGVDRAKVPPFMNFLLNEVAPTIWPIGWAFIQAEGCNDRILSSYAIDVPMIDVEIDVAETAHEIMAQADTLKGWLIANGRTAEEAEETLAKYQA